MNMKQIDFLSLIIGDIISIIYLQQFIRDICDGYFPSELQAKYPDGVPFQVISRSYRIVSSGSYYYHIPFTADL